PAGTIHRELGRQHRWERPIRQRHVLSPGALRGRDQGGTEDHPGAIKRRSRRAMTSRGFLPFAAAQGWECHHHLTTSHSAMVFHSSAPVEYATSAFTISSAVRSRLAR